MDSQPIQIDSPAGSDRPLPAQVRIIPIVRHSDKRGSLGEIYRQDQLENTSHTLQWNHVISKANVLRGVHVHHTHWDYLYMAEGSMELALIDIRRKSPDFGMTRVIELLADPPRAVIIPPGVAHGFYFAKAAVLFYGVSHYWNPEDELGCRWDDPGLDIPWQARNPLLSERDQDAGSYEQMILDYESASLHSGLSK